MLKGGPRVESRGRENALQTTLMDAGGGKFWYLFAVKNVGYASWV